MTDTPVAWEVRDGVGRITLNRPEAMNGLDVDVCRAFLEATIAADEDPSVRAVLLTGAGRMFCAGGDLKFFAGQGPELGANMKRMTAALHAGVSRLARMDAPVVVAVNGTAAGAGFSLAMTGDLVLAGRSARFVMAYTAAGLSPDGSSSYFLPRIVGLRRAQELMLTNRALWADEALDWGLVTRVVDDADLASEAEALARSLAEGPTLAFGGVKRLLVETFDSPLETQMERETLGIAGAARTEDAREGIAAFVAKRKPAFRGR